MNKNSYIIYSDGGSRGNPGDASLGWLLYSPDLELVQFNAKYLGNNVTNNYAEYSAIHDALKFCAKKQTNYKPNITKLICNLDSELVVKQLTGIYRIKNLELEKINIQITKLLLEFEEVKFNYVPREKNKFADMLVNICLDAAVSGN